MRLAPLAAAALCALALAAPVSSALVWDHPGSLREHAARAGAAPERERFVKPLQGRFESGFGPRWGRMHSGVDYSVVRDSRVRAAASGVVIATGSLRYHSGYGYVVKIRHRPGLVTMYAHLASWRVKKGQHVARGERIGRAGCTGSCTGTHLHFEVHRGGRPVNPLPYLRGRLR